jgi:hypothetical protein
MGHNELIKVLGVQVTYIDIYRARLNRRLKPMAKTHTQVLRLG